MMQTSQNSNSESGASRQMPGTSSGLNSAVTDIREFLTIHARSTLVRAALGIGMGQNVFAVNLVVQRVETKASI